MCASSGHSRQKFPNHERWRQVAQSSDDLMIILSMHATSLITYFLNTKINIIHEEDQDVGDIGTLNAPNPDQTELLPSQKN